MERFNRLDLTEEEKRKILGINAAKIFGLKSLNQV
jgi:predicted TIM-barrel fold metal-dependent hydrolase